MQETQTGFEPTTAASGRCCSAQHRQGPARARQQPGLPVSALPQGGRPQSTCAGGAAEPAEPLHRRQLPEVRPPCSREQLQLR